MGSVDEFPPAPPEMALTPKKSGAHICWRPYPFCVPCTPFHAVARGLAFFVCVAIALFVANSFTFIRFHDTFEPDLNVKETTV